MQVEVVYATQAVQRIVRLSLPPGALLRDALLASGLLEEFSLDMAQLALGIFGERELNLARPLTSHDRVEIYRPLLRDPMEARRLRAAEAEAPGRARSAPSSF